jgi:hypothetical protein
MRLAPWLAALALLGAAAPAGAEDTESGREAWLLAQALEHGWPDSPALRAQVREAVARLPDVVPDASPRALPPGAYAGEVWWECIELFVEPHCAMENLAPTPLFTCFSVPAHWALYIWAGNSLQAKLGPGFLLLWTEGHAGLEPLFVLTHGGTMTGALCLSDYGLAKTAQGNALYVEE